ncbi:alpha/beta fold hydrolase [Saccharopolyspora sp. NPDC050389]|uniref:alpha/beta fold hydrolase n=1 Tax=Saccharopolyspora sp. NPDC050389 TaxID=3155516 RepID=UPI0033F229E4
MSADTSASPSQVALLGGRKPVTVRCARTAEVPDDPIRVLLVHGLGSNAAIWDAFVALADPRCELWVAELPWRGTGIAGWTSQPVEEWIDQAVAQLPSGPDVVVAHSFGTNAVLSWLDRQDTGPSGRIAVGEREMRGVVLVSPLYRAEQEDFDWDSIGYYLHNFDQILAAGMRVRPGSRRLSPEQRLAIAVKVRDLIGPYGWIRFLDTYLRMPEVRTERLLMPFLVIGGESDSIAFPADSEALGKALPDASVHILPGSEHFPMVASAESFADLANTFLRTLSA